MKLWIFVLLGLLAQTSQGCVQIDNDIIAEQLKSTATGCAKDLKNANLPDIYLTSVGKLQVSIAGVVIVDVTCTNNGQGSWTLQVKGCITTNCKGVTPIKVEFTLIVKLSHGYKNGVFCWMPDDRSIQTTLKVSNEKGITCISGIQDPIFKSLSTLLTILVENLNGPVTSIVGSITVSLNTKWQNIRNELKIFGQTAQCKPDKMIYRDKSTTYGYAVSAGSSPAIPSVDPSLIHELAAGFFFRFYFAAELLSSIFDLAIYPFEGIRLTSYFHDQGYFTDVTEVACQIEPQPPSGCEIDYSGASISQTWIISIFNLQGELLLQFTIKTTSSFTVTVDYGQNMWLSVDNTQIDTWKLLSQPDARCDCEDDVLDKTPNVFPALSSCIFTFINSILGNNPISLSGITTYPLPESGSAPVCSPIPQCLTCGYY